MLEYQAELHRFSGALDTERKRVAGECFRGDQVRELDFAVKRIHVVSVRVDLVRANSKNNVADLQTGFRGWRSGVNAGHINTRRLAGLLGKFAQLRIARRKKPETGCRKSLVRMLLRVL